MAVAIQTTVYPAPGSADSPVALKPRYENFIGGAWVPPTDGRVPRERHARARASRSARWRRRRPPTSSSRSTPRTRPRTPGATALDRRARRRAQRDRRRDRGQPRDARGRRELGERQAGARDARRRHPAGDRPLPLLRRRGPRRGGPDLRDRRADLRLPLPRAARRRRADHPVQLPDADGGVEDRARAGRRQLHGVKPASPTPWSILKLLRGHRRHRPAGRAQRRQRPGRRDRQGARVEQADREDRVHRRDRDRPPDHALRGAEPDPVDDRARRQVAEHLLRGRDGGRRRVPRQGDRGPRALRVQQGRGLHLPVARADPRVDLRAVHGALPGAHRARSGRATRSTRRR